MTRKRTGRNIAGVEGIVTDQPDAHEGARHGAHFAVFILEVCVLSPGLCLFQRGPSGIQPPEAIAGVLRFIGRRTLEIYAIQLGGSEILVKFVPDLAP